MITKECGDTVLRLSERIELRQRLFNSFRRLGILQELIDDKEVSEIMINGHETIFVEERNRIRRWDKKFETEEQLEDVIQQIVSSINRTANRANPLTDARLRDGSRVHIALPPVALDGPVMTIRKFPEPVTIERLIAWNSVTEEAAEYLRVLVRAGYNIFISGGTNSGKTTFLNALSAFIPATERVITIEDSAELQLLHIPNLVRLETRNANVEGEGEIGMSELIRASLRMNPSRIVVGEVRGGEALYMLQAMNTGHDGSLSTGHANSAEDMLRRLESMVLSAAALPLPAIRSQIASAIDLFIHLGRLPDQSRRVLEITEMKGYEQDTFCFNKIFAYDPQEKRLKKTGRLWHREKLLRAGERLSD
ncbi:MAG: CpaF family protein [Eubacteriales bacterium]|nr:CpaF family protein [Eubacteriales bacterium]